MIKKVLITTAVIGAAFTACKKEGGVGPQQGRDDAAFSVYENSFLEGFWKLNPDWATSVGYHKYDSLLFVPDDKQSDKMLKYAKLQLDSLSRFDPTQLNEANKIDFHLIQNQMQMEEWKTQSLRAYQWDPSTYNVIGTFAVILNEPYQPLEKRLRNFYQKMANIPAYYKEAEKQIKNPVQELTDLAVDQSLNGINVFEKDFSDSLRKTKIAEAEQTLMRDRAHQAAETIKGFAGWLKALKNDHPRSFRLGKDLYEDKFKFEIQAELGPQQIYNSAVERKKVIHREMAKLSKKLWPKYFGASPTPTDSLDMIARVIDTLSSKHTQAGQFQQAIEGTIPKLSTFVRTKDLVTVDPTKQLIVRKEPGYMAGVAGASMSAPGPYDKNGNFYFNVGRIPENAESYLREYNQYTLQILCIHEAIPGHFVQQVAANNAQGMVKAVFANPAMVEGWAVYSEQMMLDNGYGGDEPEMKLMWYKWHLRAVCNTILDYGVHEQNMQKSEGLKLLMHEAFQQQAEAEGKWKRVTLTSVQLDSYYTGYKELSDLREEYKKKMGDKYKLKDFNEKFLSYGSAPIKYIKEVMLSKNTSSDSNH